MYEEIVEKIRKLRIAKRDITVYLKAQKLAKLFFIFLFFSSVFLCTIVLLGEAGYMYFAAGFFFFFGLSTIPATIKIEKDINNLVKDVENADFLESYWKADLLEWGYDWRKLDGDV